MALQSQWTSEFILITHAPLGDPRKCVRLVEERDPVELENDFGSFVVSISPLLTGTNLLLWKRVPFTLTFLIFVCEVGRLPGFRGLAYLS